MKLYVVNADNPKIHLPSEKDFLDNKFKTCLEELKLQLKKRHINMSLLHTGFLNAAVYISENDVNRSILVNGNRIEYLIDDDKLVYRHFDGVGFSMEHLKLTWTEIVRDNLKENN